MALVAVLALLVRRGSKRKEAREGGGRGEGKINTQCELKRRRRRKRKKKKRRGGKMMMNDDGGGGGDGGGREAGAGMVRQTLHWRHCRCRRANANDDPNNVGKGNMSLSVSSAGRQGTLPMVGSWVGGWLLQLLSSFGLQVVACALCHDPAMM